MEPEKQAPPTRRETLVPALAVAAVAVAAVAAAVMVQRAETQVQQREIVVDAGRPAPTQSRDVVRAPPLKPPAAQAMGGPAACKECCVVERVFAVYDPGHKQPRGYQMHIRMDDGSVRTIEQRGALAAGSRVVLEGKAVRPIS